MLVIDSHLDLAWNALQWNRDLRQSVFTLRTQEGGQSGPGRGNNTVCLPEMRRGRVAVCLGTLLARSTGKPEPHIDFRSPAQAHGIAQGQLAYYRALAAQGEIDIIADSATLDSHIAEWQAWEANEQTPQPQVGVVLSMESADPILEPGQLPEWIAAGVRVIGPAHYGPGRYAGGTGTELGLTRDGATLIREMEKAGTALDVTHLSDPAFWQAMDLFGGPVLASHNNCRAIVPHQRQFDDAQLRAIIERDGVIGAAFDNWMLWPDWTRGGTSNPAVTIADVVNHIDHVCQLAGNAKHAAIGSDLDGGFGREQSPRDLDTIADLQKVAELLRGRGYVEADVAAIMHGNWLRLLQRILP